MLRIGLTATLLACLWAAFAAPAGAAVHCAPAPCTGDFAHATIAAAVVAADAADDPDTVLIGPGVHNLGAGLSVSRATTAVRGSGVLATVLTVDPLSGSDGFTRRVISGYMGALSDLTLRLASAVVTANGSIEGADVYNGVVERVRIDAEGATFGPGDNDGAGHALLLRQGTLREVRVDLDPEADTEGLTIGANVPGAELLLEDVTTTARRPLRISAEALPDPVAVIGRRLRVTGHSGISVSDGLARISDATVDVSRAPAGSEPTGVALYQGRAPSPAGLVLDRITLIGNGDLGAAALSNGGGSGPVTALHARHVVATGFGRTLRHDLYGGNLDTRIDYSNVDTDPARLITEGDGTGTEAIDVGTGNRPGSPLLVAALAADFRLGAGSPAIDIGGDELIAGAPTDLAGAPRPVDGDGDGVVLADAGAFEYQRTVSAQPPPPTVDVLAPSIRSLRLTRARFAVARRATPLAAQRKRRPLRRGTTLRFALSEPATVRVAIQRRASGRRVGGRCRAATRGNRARKRCPRWVTAGRTLVRRDLAAGPTRIAFSGRIGRRALRPGRYRASLTAVDAAGNRSRGPARVRFQIVRAR